MADLRVALLVICPVCEALEGGACWADDGSARVDLHLSRMARLRDVIIGSDWSLYEKNGTLR